MSRFSSRKLRLAALESVGASVVDARLHGRQLQVAEARRIEQSLDSGTWDADPDLLASVLVTDGLGDAELHVVLSDQWVKYFVADIPAGVRSYAELEQVTGMRFESLFGLDPGSWALQADWRPGKSRALACAMPHALRSAIAKPGGGRQPVRSIQPFFISEYNRIAPGLRHRDAWFAVADRERLTLAYQAGSVWQGIYSHPCRQSASQTLAQVLEQALQRDSLLLETPANPSSEVFVSGIQTGAQTPGTAEIGGLRCHYLGSPNWPEQSLAWSDTFRMALAEYWP